MTPSNRAPAVSRAIAVLKLLGRSPEPMGVNAIARELGVVPSSCLHILRALAEDALVQVHPRTKHYSLGLGLLPLTQGMLRRNQFAKLVQPELEALAAKHRVSAAGVELDGADHMVVLATAQPTMPVAIEVALGSRLPALVSATGRCIAANSGLPERELKKKFSAVKWASPPSFATWLKDVEEARKEGVAQDIGNYMKGFTVVAAAVIVGGEMRQAITVVGVSEQLNGGRLTALRRDLKRCAQAVSERLEVLR